ncbi:hypothetical protein NDA00_00385 [Funiculus sociatus GB2-M2]|nr:hypothetical protein [Trichocoleus sp. FACHB-90]
MSGTNTGITEPATDTPVATSRQANQRLQPRHLVVRNARSLLMAIAINTK